jgi:hypothetical protein
MTRGSGSPNSMAAHPQRMFPILLIVFLSMVTSGETVGYGSRKKIVALKRLSGAPGVRVPVLWAFTFLSIGSGFPNALVGAVDGPVDQAGFAGKAFETETYKTVFQSHDGTSRKQLVCRPS